MYTPFGEAVASIQTVENPFRFPGQYYDQETGLHYNYFRYYNPQTGRYITPDPIGLWGGINLFVYVANNPINYTDPEGKLLPPPVIAAIVIGAGFVIFEIVWFYNITHPENPDECKIKNKQPDNQVPGSPGIPRNFPAYQQPPPPPPPITGR